MRTSHSDRRHTPWALPNAGRRTTRRADRTGRYLFVTRRYYLAGEAGSDCARRSAGDFCNLLQQSLSKVGVTKATRWRSHAERWSPAGSKRGTPPRAGFTPTGRPSRLLNT